MEYLYKYPQGAFPYADLVEENRRRGFEDFEYELVDTGVFDDDRYFDVVVEYAKASPDDLLVSVTITNRGPDTARLEVLPTLWYRNTWAQIPHFHGSPYYVYQYATCFASSAQLLRSGDEPQILPQIVEVVSQAAQHYG